LIIQEGAFSGPLIFLGLIQSYLVEDDDELEELDEEEDVLDEGSTSMAVIDKPIFFANASKELA
jgi:hypothetical protein